MMPRKEDIFYTKLKGVAAEMVEASAEYAAIMREFPDSIARIPRMKVQISSPASLRKPSGASWQTTDCSL